MKNYLAVDVGGTNIKYSLMTEEAEILEKGEVSTPYEGLEKFIEVLKGLYEKYADQVEALVMSAPGKIDANTGYFYTSGALRYIDDVNLKDKLKDVIPLPFAVENDAKAAALAEIWKGALKGVDDAYVLVIGTGLGGAIVINGKLYRGHTFAAGEFSGITTNFHTYPMNFKDAWSTHCGVNSLIGRYATKIGADPSTLNGRILFEAANNGDQNAIDAIDEYTKVLAAGLMSLQFTLDVEKVAVGGGISKQPLLLEYLRKNLHDYYESAHSAYALPATAPEVVSCQYGNDANMIGALYHYLFELGGKA